jgi:glycerol-3-phosphate dehydrogenase (NAD(P)+)
MTKGTPRAMKIAVLGAGAWGTALAIAWARREPAHQVVLWSRDEGHADAMRQTRENVLLPGVTLPDGVSPDEDFARALAGIDLAVIATPVVGLRPTVRALVQDAPGVPIVWVCKGFEAGSGLLPHQVVEAELQAAGQSATRCGTLTGPSFALEVARLQPTAVTFAARDGAWAEQVARQLHTARLRVYAHNDLVGAEVGGAVKNVLAIATGICDGLGLGFNARAALMTRGLAEIARLGLALGGRQETFMGLAGAGDLVLTCTGDLSRNRKVGLGLAEGKALPQVLAELGHVAEGVSTAREVAQLAIKHGVDMPISTTVAAVLDGLFDARAGVEQLLARSPKAEF